MNAHGIVKTVREIKDGLATEADAWEPDFRHQGCRAMGEQADG